MPAVCFGGNPPHFVPKTAIFHGLRDFFVPFSPVSRGFSAYIFPICRKAAVIPPEMRQALAVHRQKTPHFYHKNPRFFAKVSPFFPDAPLFSVAHSRLLLTECPPPNRSPARVRP